MRACSWWLARIWGQDPTHRRWRHSQAGGRAAHSHSLRVGMDKPRHWRHEHQEVVLKDPQLSTDHLLTVLDSTD